MYLSTIKAIDRKTGKGKSLVEVIADRPADDAANKVVALWREIQETSEKGGKLREQYSEAICFFENMVVGKLQLRAFSTEEADALQQQKEAALRIAREEAERAAADAHEAVRSAQEKARRAGVPFVSPEMESLTQRLKEAEQARDAAVAALAASGKPVEESESAGEETSDPAPVVPSGAPMPPPEE